MASHAHKNIWYQNLAKPQGLMGHLVGEYLAKEFYEINMWAVHTLQVQEGEKLLEIGFGPGVSIEEMVKTTPASFIAGIDYSELMVSKAKKRNAKAVQSGKVDLRHANVTDLPDFGTIFDKVIVINNIMYWPETIESLRKVRNVMNPNGLITCIIQRDDEMYRAGKCTEEINWYLHCLYQAGFVNVGVCAQPVPLERSYGQSILAGIAIYGYNPTAFQAAPKEKEQAPGEDLLIKLFKQPASVARTLDVLKRKK